MADENKTIEPEKTSIINKIKDKVKDTVSKVKETVTPSDKPKKREGENEALAKKYIRNGVCMSCGTNLAKGNNHHPRCIVIRK